MLEKLKKLVAQTSLVLSEHQLQQLGGLCRATG